jgi:hypothetical protein
MHSSGGNAEKLPQHPQISLRRRSRLVVPLVLVRRVWWYLLSELRQIPRLMSKYQSPQSQSQSRVEIVHAIILL